MRKLITIVTPVYNEGAGLETYYAEMLKAVDTPNFRKYDIEVILVDNA